MKYNPDVVDWLIRSNLMNLQLLDEHLARTLDDPRVHSYIPSIPSLFVMQLVQVRVVFYIISVHFFCSNGHRVPGIFFSVEVFMFLQNENHKGTL